MTLDYLAHLREDSARFVSVLRDAPADAEVPTCPDWAADDLLWHLGEVQWFWATVVRDAPSTPDEIQHPERPADRDGLLAFFDDATKELQTALGNVDPSEHRWTWAEEQTAGFIRRRQAHEALIHRVDAELTADVQRAPVDPELASDGVDEALRIMFGGCPPWGEISPKHGTTLRVRTTDTGRSWLVTLAAFNGTDPDGKAYRDEPAIVVADEDTGEETAATIEGTAADLDCWLWGRPTIGALTRMGEESVHEHFQDIVSQGVD
ncbi:MAG TPA: maleylpyruvate isomerase family mycothiol-dependent enzyme [Nocardioidaceae bacterium]